MIDREASDIFSPVPEDRYALSENQYGLSLKDVARVLWERLPVILLVAGLLTGLVVAFNLAQTPMYEASTKVLIVQERTGEATDQPLSSQVDGLQQLAGVMTEVVDSQRMAQATIKRTDLQVPPGELVNNLSAEQVNETPVVEIKYEDSRPERAKLIANTIPKVLPDQVSDVNIGTTGPITAKVLDPAFAPSHPVSPNPLRNGFIALVLGLMLGVGLAFLLNYLDNSWRSPAEVERISGVPTYALIPRYKLPAAGGRFATHALSSRRALRSLSESEAPNGNNERH
jgi:capsular polysaccharide biosynthesis protein